MDTALYFPYIQVPRTAWFTQILLYWDQAATIVPFSLWDQPGIYDPYMHQLEGAGLLRLMSPDDAWPVGQDQFDDAFLRLLDARAEDPGKQEAAAEPDGPQRLSPEVEFTRVHIGKMSVRLFSELACRGLALRGEGPEHETWWQIEISTADLFMAYLAAVLSGAKPGTLPVTDSSRNISMLAGTSGSDKRRLDALRYRVITEALPVPSGPVAATKLKGFKEDNSEQLRRCRTFLDGKLADLAALPDDELSDVRFSAIKQPIEDDVAKLVEQMNKRRWPDVTMLGWAGVTGASLGTAATASGAETPLALGLGVGAGALQLGKEMYTTLKLMKEPRFDARSPLAYAALASRL